jgi:hypothetical protein
MKYQKILWMSSLLNISAMGCGTANYFQSFEKKPTGIDQAALLLEGNQPEKARDLLLSKMPATSQVLLSTNVEGTGDIGFAKNLAESMLGVKGGESLLSMYATAEAQTQGVNALRILIDLSTIDKNLKAADEASLTLLDKASDDAAISTFYPAMPQKCDLQSRDVNLSLNKSMAVIYATAILRGFDASQLSSVSRELRKYLSTSNQFNAAIFSQVAFICQVMGLDGDANTEISVSEAAKIDNALAKDIISRIDEGIATVQAMVDNNPEDKNLNKALSRMSQYKTKIESNTAPTLEEKLRDFLVSQSKRK